MRPHYTLNRQTRQGSLAKTTGFFQAKSTWSHGEYREAGTIIRSVPLASPCEIRKSALLGPLALETSPGAARGLSSVYVALVE